MYRYLIMAFFGAMIFVLLCSKFCVLGSITCEFYDKNATVVKLQDECVTLGVCQCRLDSHVTWKFNNTPIFVGSKLLTNGTWAFSANNSLLIHSVKQSDVGTYTCLCSGAFQTQYILMLTDKVQKQHHRYPRKCTYMALLEMSVLLQIFLVRVNLQHINLETIDNNLSDETLSR